MARVLILTDSLSLPRRNDQEKVEWEETYVSLLRKKFPHIEFIHVGIGGATIEDLCNQLNYYSMVNPDLIILNSGIVDCAPRSLSRFELEIVKKLRVFRFVKHLFKGLRKIRGISYTSSNEFAASLERIKKVFDGIPIWSIGILPASAEYEAKLPGISKNIIEYNKILAANTTFINVDQIPKDGIMADHHHLSLNGHQFIFSKIASQLESKV